MAENNEKKLYESVPTVQSGEYITPQPLADTDGQRYVPKQYRENKNPVMEAIICFLIMIVFLLIQVVVTVPMMIIKMIELGPTIPDSMPYDQVYNLLMDSIDVVTMSFVSTIVSMIVAVIWYKKCFCKGYGLGEFKASCKKIIKPDIIGGLFFAAVGLFFFTSIIVAIIYSVSPKAIDDYNDLMDSVGLSSYDWKMIVLTVLLAPINEECIMRGIILTRLKRKMIPVLAIILSAVYFGIFHLNLVQGIYAGILGLFMAYIAYKYRSIIPSIIFHAIFNGINYLIMLLPESITDNAILLIVIPVISGILWYFLEGRKKFTEKG
ncbi:MAG: CPBP family intramembrane metalloprotease [Lachnospiraceae bacterium]|nr:CPBP family intramembrane metalloprotease [Lachnospiraceae bacterium]